MERLCREQAAHETIVRVYAGEVAKTNLKVNLVDPGIVGTRLRRRGENSANLRTLADVTEPFVRRPKRHARATARFFRLTL